MTELYASAAEWLGRDPFYALLEHLGTFAGAMSGVRLASVKRFDWFGAYVIGLVTALGGGTLRDIMLGLEPFWLSSITYFMDTLFAVVLVWVFGRRIISEQITWFIFDTLSISFFMVVGLEKALHVSNGVYQMACVDGHSWWCAVVMGVVTAVFGGVLRDICINEVPLIFRKELYALACASGGIVYFLLYWTGLVDPRICATVCFIVIFVVRALAIRYHLGVPVLSGRSKLPHHHHHHSKQNKKKQ